MYRHGLGDCFLIAFATDDPARAYYMLVDCGLIWGAPRASAAIDEVVADIQDATDGHLHILVATHEHWDHIGGFLQAQEAFESFTIDNLWMAWTESDEDQLAQDLRTKFEKEISALRLALQRARDPSSLAHVEGLLTFYGEGDGLALSALDSPKTREALNALLALTPQASRSYLTPGGAPLDLPPADGLTVPGVRIYVLGPPRDERVLRRMDPTATGRETYEEALALTTRAFSLAMRHGMAGLLNEEEAEVYHLSLPFDESLQIPSMEADNYAFFREHYGTESTTSGELTHENVRDTNADESTWRRIDDDWLSMAGELALQMDSYTNNTSLVLAIELVASGRVLLFPGDAQVGNWLSWDTLSWQVQEGSDSRTITVDDLLARTVFYKVGHHGSHNATIRALGEAAKGLELMNHPDLVAMIPVDHDTAVRKYWGKMPFPPLIERLQVKTRGRTFRSDEDFPSDKPGSLTDAEWEKLRASFRQQRLSMDYTVLDE
jgi:hypothetical protein